MKSFPGPLLWLIILLPAFFSSCKDGHNRNTREVGALVTDTTKKTSDTLFFIEGQLSAWIRNIYQDKNGNLWFATNHYGILRYSGDSLEYFSEIEGERPGRITGIAEDDSGNVWFGSYQGLLKYDPELEKQGEEFIVNVSKQDSLFNSEVWSLVLDDEGVIWMGTVDGVVLYHGSKFSPFTFPKAAVNDTTTILSYDRVCTILLDDTGKFWFGTDGFGITIYDPIEKTFSHFTKEDGLGDNNVANLTQDSNGNIWAGTMYGGVSRIDPNRDARDGKPFFNYTESGVISGQEAYGFFEDSKGRIWFSVENQGVYRFDPAEKDNPEGAFTKYSKDHGLLSNGIISIFEDREGRFWLGGWGGLFRYYEGPDIEKSNTFVSVTKNGPWEK